jgi:REP element-mobilizing transposase RayT
MIKNMNDTLPKCCFRCLAASKNAFMGEDCQICMDQGITESLLCDLLRKGSSLATFKCHAFRPNLTLVGKNKKNNCLSVCQDKKEYFNEVVQMISSGKCAGGCGGQCVLSKKSTATNKKYHVIWSVFQRKPLFVRSEKYVSYLHDILLSCGKLMKGRALLLWLAADHLHLYVESDGNEPVLEVIDDLQELVHDALVEEFSEFNNIGNMIWQKDFFMEEL